MAEPVSWLLLERYALGELSEVERRAVEARLAESAEDRACLEAIRNDASELPPLPAPREPRRLRSLAPFATLLAAAAALLLMVRPGDELPPARRQVGTGTKGGDVAISLVSDRHGEAPTTFGAGERFKLLVTCPPGFAEPLRPVVFQGGERFEPLPSAAVACGNRVPWPGAFTLDGREAATVCLAWSASDASSASELGDHAVCTVLEPR